MKKIFYGMVLLTSVAACEDHQHGTPRANDTVVISRSNEKDTLKGSLKAYTKKKINDATINIRYHSPAVRGRMIWGGLVPFDKIWVAGAHSATSLEIDRDLIIDNQTIPAGKYGLFAIPGQAEWTLVLNKNWDQHLTDEYDQMDDVLRWKVIPEALDNPQERLMYVLDQTGEYKGNLELVWEKLRIKTPFEIRRGSEP